MHARYEVCQILTTPPTPHRGRYVSSRILQGEPSEKSGAGLRLVRKKGSLLLYSKGRELSLYDGQNDFLPQSIENSEQRR